MRRANTAHLWIH